MAFPKISPKEHSCLTCRWFDFDPSKGERWRDNRYCICPSKLEVEGGQCKMWKDTRTLWQRLLRKTVVKAFCSDSKTSKVTT